MKSIKGQNFIFDQVRKKWLVLTPEEWVRQHVVNFLITIRKYPVSMIVLEKELNLNGLKRRYDIVVYDRGLNPFLIVECKAPYISLDRAVIEQALRYNLVMKAPLLMITNGVQDRIFDSGNRETDLPDALPEIIL